MCLGLASPAHASDGECYDAKVVAQIVDQVPSIPPEFEDGSIILRWPWFIDLVVAKAIEGEVPKGQIRALSVQHTYWRSGLGRKHWLLRHNSEGGFNLLGLASELDLPRCEADQLPAPAFLRPAEGTSLGNLRREGEARYGHRRER